MRALQLFLWVSLFALAAVLVAHSWPRGECPCVEVAP